MAVHRFGHRSQSGVIVLLSVITLGVVSLGLAVALLVAGQRAADTLARIREATAARLYVDACAESALQSIRDDRFYPLSGGRTFDQFPQGECGWVASRAGREGDEDWGHSPTGEFQETIIAAARSGKAVRKLIVRVAEVRPTVLVSKWTEVTGWQDSDVPVIWCHTGTGGANTLVCQAYFSGRIGS